MGARPIALLDGLRFGAPDHDFERAVAGIGAYGNSRRRADGRRRGRLRRGVRGQLPRQRDVRRAPSRRARHAREGARSPGTSSCSTARRPAATGSAAPRCSRAQELGEDDADKRPSVQVGDPFTGKKLIEASVELVERGLVESLQDCGAAGPRLRARGDGLRRRGHRRPPRPRAAARGRHGAVGDHDLGVAGADGRRRPAADARRGARGVRALGAAVHA